MLLQKNIAIEIDSTMTVVEFEESRHSMKIIKEIFHAARNIGIGVMMCESIAILCETNQISV